MALPQVSASSSKVIVSLPGWGTFMTLQARAFLRFKGLLWLGELVTVASMPRTLGRIGRRNRPPHLNLVRRLSFVFVDDDGFGRNRRGGARNVLTW